MCVSRIYCVDIHFQVKILIIIAQEAPLHLVCENALYGASASFLVCHNKVQHHLSDDAKKHSMQFHVILRLKTRCPSRVMRDLTLNNDPSGQNAWKRYGKTGVLTKLRTKEEYIAAAETYLTPNYGKRDLVLVRGEKCKVWDIDGNEYLDFLSGISVNNLGHCPPAVVEAVQAQIQQFMHCSNFYIIPSQVELAAQLCELSFARRCFFCNSGAEANEAAIKLARLYAKKKFSPEGYEIITMRNSFHGRTLATISATGQEKVQKGFEPLVPGFRYATFNDIESVRAAITEHTCAIMLEPVQGEGGIVPAQPEFLKAVKDLCVERGFLLIFDEVQCGMGRCGRLFAHQLYGIDPDIMTLAKALGNGYPVAAMLATEEVGQHLTAGTHGSTFGGNPPACAAGVAVLREMVTKNIPAYAEQMGNKFVGMLRELLSSLPNVKEIRSKGLMVGIELTHEGAQVVKECLKRGLIINCTMGNVLRLLPPLIVTEDECKHAATIISEVLQLESVTGTGSSSNTAANA